MVEHRAHLKSNNIEAILKLPLI